MYIVHAATTLFETCVVADDNFTNCEFPPKIELWDSCHIMVFDWTEDDFTKMANINIFR